MYPQLMIKYIMLLEMDDKIERLEEENITFRRNLVIAECDRADR